MTSHTNLIVAAAEREGAPTIPWNYIYWCDQVRKRTKVKYVSLQYCTYLNAQSLKARASLKVSVASVVIVGEEPLGSVFRKQPPIISHNEEITRGEGPGKGYVSELEACQGVLLDSAKQDHTITLPKCCCFGGRARFSTQLVTLICTVEQKILQSREEAVFV